MTTIREAAKEALLVQDACNLSGVVHSFSRLLTDVIWPEAHAQGKGTDYVNNHPVVALFIDKLRSLCSTDVMDAWKECERLSE
jgi:hypothetical protein